MGLIAGPRSRPSAHVALHGHDKVSVLSRTRTVSRRPDTLAKRQAAPGTSSERSHLVHVLCPMAPGLRTRTLAAFDAAHSRHLPRERRYRY